MQHQYGWSIWLGKTKLMFEWLSLDAKDLSPVEGDVM